MVKNDFIKKYFSCLSKIFVCVAFAFLLVFSFGQNDLKKTYSYNNYNVVDMRHGGGNSANFVCVDGHTEVSKPKYMYKVASEKDGSTNFPDIYSKFNPLKNGENGWK